MVFLLRCIFASKIWWGSHDGRLVIHYSMELHLQSLIILFFFLDFLPYSSQIRLVLVSLFVHSLLSCHTLCCLVRLKACGLSDASSRHAPVLFLIECHGLLIRMRLVMSCWTEATHSSWNLKVDYTLKLSFRRFVILGFVYWILLFVLGDTWMVALLLWCNRVSQVFVSRFLAWLWMMLRSCLNWWICLDIQVEIVLSESTNIASTVRVSRSSRWSLLCRMSLSD